MSYYAILLFNGLVTGGVLALMSLGMSIIFGMMRVVNFMHGAMFMLGAIVAVILGSHLGVSLWLGFLISAVLVGLLGVIIERLLIRRLYGLDLAYILILTFGLSLIIEDVVRIFYGVTSAPYLVPDLLKGAVSLGFASYPKYRLFVVVVSVFLCLGTYLALERTRLGALIRAASERPDLLKCFGGNVPLLVSGTFFFASALAGLAGALSAPMRNVSPFMGEEMINFVFAVVVAGGMGSIAGSAIMGFASGLVSAIAAIFYAPAASAVIYILMLVVLLIRPGGIFQGIDISHFALHYTPMTERARRVFLSRPTALIALAATLLLPWLVYPVLATDIILWGLFAVGFDLLFAIGGLLSFGQAAYWGMSAYVTGILMVKFGAPMFLSLLGGVALSTIVSLLFGFIVARKKGIYFSMITFAFASIVYFVVNQFPDYTGGEDGLHGLVRPTLLGLDLKDDRIFYYVCLAAAALVIFTVIRLLKSPYGLALLGARENEQRMMSLGYSVYGLRVKAYVFSAVVCSIGGALYALNHQFVTLEMVSWRASGEPIMMTLLGGAGTIFGPFLGSGIVLLMRNTLSTITDNGSLFLGLLFVAVVLLFRRGILGEIVHHSVDRATSPDMPAKGELYAANPNQIATTGEVADA
ncbi:ABC transporter permease [Mesorhizobium sp. BH1-1-4]|uniref:ABC transporter permease n=1 Tax=Mesorhizobium sp. BH1-1-4 TaxID=2876662 RepID=UPI001CD0817A|nr:ABC transporter permease [Mesorhizobium sp. BH1-1-4]MBZ9992841.1 ABC transporter permease [Mesorhizobium sp. BH1-1-4]